VAANPYVHGLSWSHVGAILQPWGGATIAVVNYAPVQLLLHAVAWQLFGDAVTGHHVVNVALHAAAAVLLLPLLLRSGVPAAAALLGSAIFLLHPANVEAVAWISQLKTTSAMVLMLGALLAQPRRPALATLLFVLALLAKGTAAVALPVAFGLEWLRTGRVRGRWLALWIAVFAAYALVEFGAHQRSGAAAATLYDTPIVLARTIAALALRYLVMAATSFGVSAFHEPEPVRSWLDPWWLASLAALGLLGARLVATLRARREEAVWWIWALVSYGPVSQIFPFLYPMADRYLYFILPGLLGGTLLAAADLAGRLPARRRALAGRIGIALGAALCVGFGVHSHARAAIWRSPATILADSARHYPNGVSANLMRAKAAALRADAPAAVAAIRAAMARGYNRYEQLLADPAFQQIADDPEFRAVVRDIAAGWIEAGRGWEHPSQMELRKLASAHAVRGERDEAVALLRRALETPGPLEAEIRDDLARLGAQP
jgi:protein O-mannosyl-transferase